jgi:hypothetical protein
MNHIQDFLEQMEQMSAMHAGGPPADRSHHTVMGWIADHGRPYESEPLTDDELVWLFTLLDREGSRYQIKECYYNSQKVLLHADAWSHFVEHDEHELIYVEGYAESIIPVHHGWLSLNGKVVDLTMRLREPLNRTSRVHRRRLRNRVLGEFPERRSYFGVPFETKSVRAFVRRTGTLGSLIDDWQSGFPIFEPDSPDCPVLLGGQA